MQEIKEMLKIPKSTIGRHIQRLGLVNPFSAKQRPYHHICNDVSLFGTKRVKKLDIWIPHELKEIHLTKRINACDMQDAYAMNSILS